MLTSLSVFGKEREKEKKLEEDRNVPQSAFLGPTLWDKTLPYDGDNFQLEYMNLEEFLSENGIPSSPLPHDQSHHHQPQQPCLQQASVSVMDLSSRANTSIHTGMIPQTCMQTPGRPGKSALAVNWINFYLSISQSVRMEQGHFTYAWNIWAAYQKEFNYSFVWMCLSQPLIIPNINRNILSATRLNTTWPAAQEVKLIEFFGWFMPDCLGDQTCILHTHSLNENAVGVSTVHWKQGTGNWRSC